MSKNRATCVVRDINGIGQYVRVTKDTIFVPGERLFTGLFDWDTEKTGPSDSHVVEIGLPSGKLSESKVLSCVLRERMPGTNHFDYVEAKTVPLVDGERLFVGIFSGEVIRTGPYKSHSKAVYAALLVNETVVEPEPAVAA